jgi:hypothetical protein
MEEEKKESTSVEDERDFEKYMAKVDLSKIDEDWEEEDWEKFTENKRDLGFIYTRDIVDECCSELLLVEGDSLVATMLENPLLDWSRGGKEEDFTISSCRTNAAFGLLGGKFSCQTSV